jgi:glucan 1,3-beta-glucosidase
MRNLTFYNAKTAIFQNWDWGWTYQGISINNCGVGIDMTHIETATDAAAFGEQLVGSVTLIDSDINNTPVGVNTSRSSTSKAPSGGSLILENVRLNKVTTAVAGPSSVLLPGSEGKTVITAWGQGHSYTTNGPVDFAGPYTPTRPSSLMAGTDYYTRSKPQYENLPSSSFLSVRSAGAKGDGTTDDTAVLNAILALGASSGKVVYFDSGDYLVTSTIYIPAGCRITGESYPVILSSGSFFADVNSPKPVIQVGKPGESGNVEWADMIVSTKGAQAGAILIEWNLASSGIPSGMWDVHTRIGGFAGSNLQLPDCPVTTGTTVTRENLPANCIAAFMSMHITKSASGVYMENVWLWVADHDIERVTSADPTRISIYAGRGLLIESVVGGIWLIGTAVEHHVLYQYQLSTTANIMMGQIQTETAYMQPNPDATVPFTVDATYNDPTIQTGDSGWGVRIFSSQDIAIYGAGLYSFFSNTATTCSDRGNGEACQKRIFSVENSHVSVYNLNTVGTTKMVTVDGTDVADYQDNLNGFVDTIALFKS